MAFDAAVRPVKPAVRCGRVVEPTANLHLWMPPLMQVIFECFGNVNGCSHLSGLLMRRFRCRWPVWRYAVQFQISLAG